LLSYPHDAYRKLGSGFDIHMAPRRTFYLAPGHYIEVGTNHSSLDRSEPDPAEDVAVGTIPPPRFRVLDG